jgi:hypothetical protein
MGNILIARELKARKILTPSAYKAQHGEKRFSTYPPVVKGDLCDWSHGTIGQMLNNRVYLGELTSLKTEVANCKTKQRVEVPAERRVVTPNAHEAIISLELFNKVREIRVSHASPNERKRFNLFRNKLYCECCGHPLTITRKQLMDREADIYFCMYHYTHPEVCPKTHRVYHEMLYPYVLQQVQSFAKSMKRRKVNSLLKEYAEIEELTPEILDNVIERIEIGYVKRKSKPGNVIQIYWKLK